MAILNFPRSRSLGNAQSRNPALGNAPIYGMNPTGAQTAARMTLGGKPVSALAPEQDQFSSAFKFHQQDPAEYPGYAGGSPVPSSIPIPYAGGDVVGASQAYRNAGLKTYNQNRSALAAQPQPQSSVSNQLRIADYFATPQADLALAGRMNALTAASQAANPPQQQAPVPIEQTSTAANNMRTWDSALQNNPTPYGNAQYANDPNRVTADQAYQIAQQSAASRAAGGAAGDPTGLGGRFGSGSALGQSVAAYQRGLTGEARGEGVFIQPGGYGSPKVYEQFNNTPEGAFEKATQMAKERAAGRASRSALAESENARRLAEIGGPTSALAQKRAARANEQGAFLAANKGVNATAIGREKRRLDRAVNRGKITREAADKEMGKFTSGKSALATMQPGDQTLRNPPQKGNLTPQPPDKAMENVAFLAENNQAVKDAKLTPTSTVTDVLRHFSQIDPKQMTSDQKFQAARGLHDYMLSQVESGNWTIPGNAGSELIPETVLIGLDGIKPGNKQQMVQWYESMIGRSASIIGIPAPVGQPYRIQELPAFGM